MSGTVGLSVGRNARRAWRLALTGALLIASGAFAFGRRDGEYLRP